MSIPLKTCGKRSKIAIIHIGPASYDRQESAERLRRRANIIKGMGEYVGCEIAWLSCEEDVLARCATTDTSLFSDISGLEALFRGSVAVWWFGCILKPQQVEYLCRWIQRTLRSFGMDVPCHELPDVVDEVFNLSKSGPLLEAAGVPQAKTQTFPLQLEGVHREQDIEAKIRDVVSREHFADGTFFFRTFYGTQKRSPYLNRATSYEEFVRGGVDMLEMLLGHHPIGGIAIREWLPIDHHFDDLLGIKTRLEFRVFVLDGQPVMWIWHAAQKTEIERCVKRGMFEGVLLTDVQKREMIRLAKIVGNTLRSRFVVADFALLEGGDVVLIEVNPGHCSEWGHPAAYAGVYARWICHMAQLPFHSCEALCDAMDIDMWGRGVLFDVLELGE